MYVTRKPTPFPKEMKPQWQRQVASTLTAPHANYCFTCFRLGFFCFTFLELVVEEKAESNAKEGEEWVAVGSSGGKKKQKKKKKRTTGQKDKKWLDRQIMYVTSKPTLKKNETTMVTSGRFHLNSTARKLRAHSFRRTVVLKHIHIFFCSY
jgi:hypothetical protein